MHLGGPRLSDLTGGKAMRRGGCEAVRILAMLGSVAFPETTRAQSDLHVKGSLAVAGAEDDNIYSTPANAERDRISRLTPEMEAGYRSARLSLSGRYTFDAERFEEHPELNTMRARQNASFDLRANASSLVTIGARGDYVTTLTPGELNLQTGLSAGRVRARRLTFGPSLECRLDPVTVGSVAYTQIRDELSGGATAETRTATVDLKRRVSSRDTGSVGYTLSRFDFDDSATSAHALSFGWDRRITPRSDLSLRAGPRLSDGALKPEGSFSVRHGSRRTDLSLTYSRSLTTVIGRGGTVISEGLAPGIAFRPANFLRLSAAPGLFKVRGSSGGPAARVYVVNLEASCSLGPWMSLVGGYHRTLQEGTLDAFESPDGAGDLARHVFLLRLVAHPAVGRQAAGGTRIEEKE
jgi:hypothetical protein